MNPIEQATIDYLDYLATDDFNPEDVTAYSDEVFATAMEYYHGQKVWEKINKLM